MKNTSKTNKLIAKFMNLPKFNADIPLYEAKKNIAFPVNKLEYKMNTTDL